MGRLFRDYFKIQNIKVLYRTPYIHTPTGIVARVVRTLKENLSPDMKACERFLKVLYMSLEVMKKHHKRD